MASDAQHYRDAALSGYEAAVRTADEIRAAGRRAEAIRADVTQWAQVKAMVDQTVEKLGGSRHPGLQNARRGPHSPRSEHLSEEAWRVPRPWRSTCAASSSAARRPSQFSRAARDLHHQHRLRSGQERRPGDGPLLASKFAVVGFTNALAKEWRASASGRTPSVPASSALRCGSI